MFNFFKRFNCKHNKIIKEIEEIGNWQDCSIDYLHITKCKKCGKIIKKELKNNKNQKEK